MSESSLEEDQEISENVLNRIFYEQSTHDQITTILRTYKDQSFGYLDAVTRLSHVFLRLLEKYSKQNVDMQVRTRRRARKKKQKEQPTQDGNVEDRMMEVEDVAEAQRVTSERKFDFTRFATKFVNQSSVETFVTFMRYYKDLDEEQLRRAHRFFYRVAFKMDSLLYLYRVDIIALFQRLIKGPLGLRIDGVLYNEWTELVRRISRRLVKKMQERPALGVELLFSKIPSTLYYLEHGYDRELPAKKARHVADVEVKPGMERADQIGVAVSVLINQSKSFFLNSVKDFLLSAANERKAWEDADSARQALAGNSDDNIHQSIEMSQGSLFGSQSQPEAIVELPQPTPPPRTSMPPSILIRLTGPEQREAMQRDKHARLLLTLLGCQCLNSTDDDPTAETIWTLPCSITAAQLFSDLELVRTHEYAPPTYDDGKTAEDFLRRKAPARRKAFEDEDSRSNADDEDPNDTSLFLPGGPTTRRSSQSPARKPGRRRQRHSPDAALDDDVLEARREARRKAESARNARIKSAMFVHESDDETDEERDTAFFALEEVRRRRATQLAISTAGSLKRAGGDTDAGTEKRRRTGGFPETSEDDDDIAAVESPDMRPDSEAETEPDTTPPSSQLPSLGAGNDEGEEADSDKENAVVVPKAGQRRAVRAGFVVESDSE